MPASVFSPDERPRFIPPTERLVVRSGEFALSHGEVVAPHRHFHAHTRLCRRASLLPPLSLLLYAERFDIETLVIYKLSSRKFTTQHDLY